MANVYQMVTDRIVEEMKKGIIPWHRPWVCLGSEEQAISYVSRKPYSLLNQLLLGRPGEWLTWNQIHALGGSVKKGAKSGLVVFYTKLEIETETPEGEKDKKTVPVLKWYRVYHQEDTEGIQSKLEPKTQDTEGKPALEPVSAAETIINDYLEREPELKFHSDKESGSAYYSPMTDTVVVPMLGQYQIVEEYYSTTFHELTHSTMKETRCNRRGEDRAAAFGDSNYSREELVAELGSAMLCNRAGLDSKKAFRNTVAYIQSWLKALKNDPKMIVWAASRAETAAKYILNEI